MNRPKAFSHAGAAKSPIRGDDSLLRYTSSTADLLHGGPRLEGVKGADSQLGFYYLPFLQCSH